MSVHAKENNYVCPEVTEENILTIKGGRLVIFIIKAKTLPLLYTYNWLSSAGWLAKLQYCFKEAYFSMDKWRLINQIPVMKINDLWKSTSQSLKRLRNVWACLWHLISQFRYFACLVFLSEQKSGNIACIDIPCRSCMWRHLWAMIRTLKKTDQEWKF